MRMLIAFALGECLGVVFGEVALFGVLGAALGAHLDSRRSYGCRSPQK